MNKFLKLIGIFGFSSIAFANYAQDKPIIEPIKTESSQPTEDMFIDDIVRKTLIEDKRLMAVQPIREADVVWEKRIQRVIDTREKLNLPFRSQESNLFTAFRKMIDAGDLTAFSSDDFKLILTKEEVEKKMSSTDTLEDFNPDTYEQVIKIVKNEINWENINSYRIKEVWYFDKQRSRMDVRILGIAPIYASPKDIESGIPPSPLFWIYYPQAREALSKVRTFNDDNDVAPMTYSDIFDERVFTSYIYKRSNVLDYRLKDFFVPDPDDTENLAGIDMLLYSDKIKNELLNFEHDLWEY